MSKTAKTSKRKVPKMPKGEAEQVRIRRSLGHDFALKQDEHGRTRLIAGTVEAERAYERSNGGIVRVRSSDPLKGISSLTKAQRKAGEKYRETYELCAGYGASAIPLQVKVDGGRGGSGIPEAISIAHGSLIDANTAIGHHEIVSVVADICVVGLTASDIALKTGDVRPAITKLLKIGLDNLAVHYGIVPGPK